ARAVTRIVRIVPEPQRHRGQRLGADELADFACDRAALVVEGFHRTAEQAALHGAGRLWQLAVAADEGAGKVGAARNVGPPDIRLCAAAVEPGKPGEARIEPGLRVGAERRAGGAECAQ